MSTGSRALQDQIPVISSRIKSLVNSDLKEICRGENLAVSGVKASLQARIIQRLQDLAQTGDFQGIARLRYRVANHGQSPPETLPTYPSSGSPNGYEMAQNGYGRPPAQAVPPRPPMYQTRILFKESPFFEVLEILGPPIHLELTPNHRTNASGHVTLSQQTCDLLKADNTVRVMLYSAADAPLAPYARQDISFPAQVEIKVGADEVKANFKGLKNKPGSTRPADITDLIRKLPNYRNNISVTYALTQKASSQEKFTVIVHLVKKRSVEELTERIQRQRVIAKQTTINEMQKKASDADIVVSSTVMTLKDPVSTLRIAIPCRSTICNHNQCFDVSSFLQLQEQAPTWTCPHCNKVVTFESLAVDQYFQEILRSVPKSADQVTIEPDGRWSQGSDTGGQTPRNSTAAKFEDEDSDDLVEISDYRVSNLKTEAATTPLSLARTPPLSSREQSTALSAPRSSHKRTSDVIDLTLSDDEGPPAKKVAYDTPSSLPDPSRNGYRQQSYRPQASAHPPSRSHNGAPPYRIAQSPPQPPQPTYTSYQSRLPAPSTSYPNPGSYNDYSSSP